MITPYVDDFQALDKIPVIYSRLEKLVLPSILDTSLSSMMM